MENKNTIIYIIIGIILIALIGTQTTLFSFFFTSLPNANVVPNVINEGETSSVRFSALLQEIGPQDGRYGSGVYINKNKLCYNTAGISNGDTYENNCMIGSSNYVVGNNLVEVFQAYKSSSGGVGFATTLFNSYEGAVAYDNYKKGDGGKLVRMCVYGTPNGESYESDDQRWYQYPLNTEFERISGARPGDSGGGDCAGARCQSCLKFIESSNYEKKNLNLIVYPLALPPIINQTQNYIIINNTVYLIDNSTQIIKLVSCTSNSDCGTNAICKNAGQQDSYCLLTQKDTIIKDWDLSQLTEPPIVYYLLGAGFLIMLLWFTRR